jgi:archaellin
MAGTQGDSMVARRRSGGRDRGQSDLNTVLAFVVVLVVVLLVAPVVLGFLGMPVRESGTLSGSAEVRQSAPASVVVLGVEGTAVSQASVGAVELVVTRDEGVGEIAFDGVTVTWTDPSGSYHIASGTDGAPGADGTFDAQPLGNISRPRLSAFGDRVAVRFDLGSNNVQRADEFGRRLPAGAAVAVTFSTNEGAVTQVRFRVPDRLGGEDTRLPIVE